MKQNREMERVRIAVGSRNPVKVEAARRVFGQLEEVAAGQWQCAVEGLAIAASVGEQPLGEEATRAGAEERAQGALTAGAYAFGVGLEGGVAFTPEGAYLIGYAAVADRVGRVNVGSCVRLLLPPEVAARVQAGEELGPVMDEVAGEANLKQKAGAIGFLTAGLVPRTLIWQVALSCALAPWLHPALYGWEGKALLPVR